MLRRPLARRRGGSRHRPARAERLRQVDADARDRRRAERRVGRRCAVLGVAAGSPAAAPPGRLRDAGAVGLRRPDRAREPALLRAGARRRRATRSTRCSRRSALDGVRRARSSAGSRAGSARASRSRPRCSARPSCSCSTSRRSASTRCCAATSGRRSTSSPTAGATLLVSSHVMDEADRCDELLLLREGALIATGSPDELRARTGSSDLDDAFLALVEAARVSPRVTLATALRVLTPAAPRPAHDRAAPRRPGRAGRAARATCFDGQPLAFQRIGGPLLGIFPFISMFLVTSITMLRERTTGTLERLMTMPLAKLDLLRRATRSRSARSRSSRRRCVVGGRALGARPARRRRRRGRWSRSPSATRCSAWRSASSSARSRRPSSRPCSSCRRSSSRRCCSAACSSPRDEMARVLEAVSWALPLTYAYDALDRVTHRAREAPRSRATSP